MGKMIELRSNKARAHVILRGSVEATDVNGSKRIVNGPVKIVFRDGRAQLAEEHMDLLRAATAFTGDGGEKLVWLAEDLVVSDINGPRVVVGAVGAPGVKRSIAPKEGWDAATAKQVVEWVQDGIVHDLEAAWAWEMAGGRRKTVVTAITNRLLSDEPAEHKDESGVTDSEAEVVSGFSDMEVSIPEGSVA